MIIGKSNAMDKTFCFTAVQCMLEEDIIVTFKKLN